MPPPQPGTGKRPPNPNAITITHRGPRAGDLGHATSTVGRGRSQRLGRYTTRAVTAYISHDERPVGGGNQRAYAAEYQHRYRYASAGSGDIDDVNGVNYEFFGATSGGEGATTSGSVGDDPTALNPGLDGAFIAYLRTHYPSYAQHFRWGPVGMRSDGNVPTGGGADGDYVSDEGYYNYDRLLALDEGVGGGESMGVRNSALAHMGNSKAALETLLRPISVTDYFQILASRGSVQPNEPSTTEAPSCCICLEEFTNGGLGGDGDPQQQHHSQPPARRIRGPSAAGAAEATARPQQAQPQTSGKRALIIELPRCLHAFHGGCLRSWFDAHHTCPLCRRGLLED